jgi:hypothetical protein
MAVEYIDFIPKYADNQETELEGIAWLIFYRWNTADKAWYMDLSSVETGTVLKGLKLVGGSNILRPHAVAELGKIFVVDTEGKQENPNYEDFGDRFKVLYVPKADADAFPL